MISKYSKISIEHKHEIITIDYNQNEDIMTIMFEKVGIYVKDIIYKDLFGKENRVESSFDISVANT